MTHSYHNDVCQKLILMFDNHVSEDKIKNFSDKNMGGFMLDYSMSNASLLVFYVVHTKICIHICINHKLKEYTVKFKTAITHEDRIYYSKRITHWLNNVYFHLGSY